MLIVSVFFLLNYVNAILTYDTCELLTSIVRKEVLTFGSSYETTEFALKIACHIDPKSTHVCDYYLSELDETINLIVKGSTDVYICKQLLTCQNEHSVFNKRDTFKPMHALEFSFNYECNAYIIDILDMFVFELIDDKIYAKLSKRSDYIHFSMFRYIDDS